MNRYGDKRSSDYGDDDSSKSGHSYGDDEGDDHEDRPEDDEDFIDLAGKVLASKYIMIDPLGSGSYSTVWLSYNMTVNKFFAIKVQNAADYRAGEDECNLYKMLRTKKCEYINQLMDDFIFESEMGEHVCMVFELCSGSVYDLIKSGRYSKGLSFDTTKMIIYQLLVAVNVLTKDFKVIHPDIKPENILLVGTNNKVKSIIDRFTILYKKFGNKKNKKNVGLIAKNVVDGLGLKGSSATGAAGVGVGVNGKGAGKGVGKGGKNVVVEKAPTATKPGKEKEIEKEKEKENEKEGDKSNNALPVDKDLILHDKLNIKLTDFSGCVDLNHLIDDIQLTRYYRAPEMLLYYKYDETCEIWSVGCMFYEILTGDILFEPDKKRRSNRDRQHLFEIQKKLGRIPEHLFAQSKNKKYFFRNDGTMKWQFDFPYKPLSSAVTSRLTNRKDITSGDTLLILDLLYKMLEYDPFKRLSAEECLQHKLFDSIRMR